MKKIIFILVTFLIAFSTAYATHNRAGEITYEHLTGLNYRIRVTTYTNILNTTADRCEVTVYFGDGDSAKAPRINGILNGTCAPNGMGVQITPDTKWNIYEIDHIYPGPSNYTITMEDPNRNAGICNIPNSVMSSFFLHSVLVINPFLGDNNSPILTNLPLDNACVGVCFKHNPGAFDPDGDSLSYSLITCYANGGPIIGYSLPPNLNYSDIDALRGDLVWCAPNQICQYNVAILISEYRKLQGSNTFYFIGSIVRDMQINVGSCANTPPDIAPINDTCVVAGTQLQLHVSATDAQANLVSLSASGGPFILTPGATFNSSPAFTTASGTFHWTPGCSAVRTSPYLVTFQAVDNASTQLVDFQSVFIRVVAPAPTGLSAAPSGASIIVSWNAPFCNSLGGSNPLINYLVYRKNTCDPWVHSPCETGVPVISGYTYIGTATAPSTTYTDNNNGAGLSQGTDYSYIVVATYFDGSQSYASANVCAHLVADVPIITNVSVLSTDVTNGNIWVHWVKPIGNTANLDTLINPPPYEFRLMKAHGQGISVGTFSQVSSYSYSSYSQMTDTGYVNTNRNTQDSAFTYRVDLYSNGIFTGSSQTASSVFLFSTPAGNTVNLSWQAFVPWANYKYFIYKEVPTTSGNYILIDSTVTTFFSDTGLVNGRTYCYKIVTKGEYSDPLLPRPLYNTSQIKCEKPIDIIPPCQPPFSVERDCGIFQNVISWTNPNTTCSNDAVGYHIYFSPTIEGEMQLIYSSNDMNTTTYTHVYLYEGIPSVAGCYAVTAVDSFNNESPVIKKICVDNCPEYELPNVFTPNGDNLNDLVTPLPGWRYVKDVDMKIYDRWGVLMFETTNPAIQWDGKSKDSKLLCSDGVYFYICIVNEIRVEGIKPRILKGFIQLLHEKTTPPH